jgi:hypothetical protein
MWRRHFVVIGVVAHSRRVEKALLKKSRAQNKRVKGKGATTSDDEAVSCPEPPATGCLTKEGVDGIMKAFEGAVVAISNVRRTTKKKGLYFIVFVLLDCSCCLLSDAAGHLWYWTTTFVK